MSEDLPTLGWPARDEYGSMIYEGDGPMRPTEK